ncbi:MAG TPA: hypothetical protein VE088_00450 [Gaiellaceae bacterium]|jgi:hypothetical protein|nr:hypothetical protein [Gaiellaceae bacterium]
MSGRRSLRRLWRSPYVVAAAVLLFASGLAAGGTTLASFSAQTQNKTSTFAGGWIGAATGPLTVTPSGYNGALGWTPATHGLDGQQLYGLDNGTSASCPASGYASLATIASKTTNAYTDSSTALDNPRSNVNGHYVCYQLASTRSGSSWTASASFPATVLGLVPTAVSYVGNPLTTGSTFTLSYNQNVAYSGGTIEVCISSGTVTFGSAASCTASIGTLSGGTASKSITCSSSSVTVVNSTQLQIALGSCPNGNGNMVTMSGGPVTYTATGTTVSSSTGSAPQCTTSLCQPQMTSW